MDQEQCHLLYGSSPMPPHRLCLETSFTSLQSPTVEVYQNSSVNSSQTGSYYPSKISPIQLSSILYPDLQSRSPSWNNQPPGCSSLVTSPQSWQVPIGATDLHVHDGLTRKNSAPVSTAVIFNNHRNNTKYDKSYKFKSYHSTPYVNTNPEKLKLRAKVSSLDNGGRIDLIHDDWFGLAPLASPESLSEVSSISSRASFGVLFGDKTNLTEVISTSYELRTPTVMRRTPKIAGNLSTCADDIKSVRYFQKLGRTSMVLRCPSQNGSSRTDSSGDLSYESASSAIKCCPNKFDCTTKSSFLQNKMNDLGFINTSTETDSYASAENILDEPISNHFKHCVVSDHKLCNSGCPNCPCKYESDINLHTPSGSAIVNRNSKKSCCQNYDHTDCVFDANEKSFSTSSEIPISTKSSPESVKKSTKSTSTVFMETHFDQNFFTDITPKPDHLNLPLKTQLNPYLSTPTIEKLQVPVHLHKSQISSTVYSPDNIISSRLPDRSSPFSPQIMSPTSPQIDQDTISNFAIDLTLDPENRSMMQFNLVKQPEVVKNSPSVDSGSICKTPCETKSVSFNPQIVNLDPSMIQTDSRSFFDLKSIIKECPPANSEKPKQNFNIESIEKYSVIDPKNTTQSEESYDKKMSKKTDRWFLLPRRSPKKSETSNNVKTPVTKRQKPIDEQCFSKNESLPLLSGLSSTAEKTSPSYVRRKKYIYPITKIGRGESSV